ncbi:MAG: hypothetical protein C0467_05995 [Planctomycetaceae bacterium]|nr:hypothetical protein [Planctomycetaceae bacterium]
MLVLTRTAPPDWGTDRGDRENEVILVLPDGQRVTVVMLTRYTSRGTTRLKVAIDAPLDVKVIRGELDTKAASAGAR